MTFEEYWNAVDNKPVHIPGTVPPPPGVAPTRVDLLRSYSDQIKGFRTNKNQRTDLLRSYSDAMNTTPDRSAQQARGMTRSSMMSEIPYPAMPTVPPMPYAQLMDPTNAAINSDLARFGQGVSNFLGPRSTTNPSFQPMAGEQTALQMPGVADALRRLLSGYADPGPGFRDMPRYNPNSAQPAATPYPPPPWLNFRNWLETGERGPLPLDARQPGGYPAPAYTPMPEAYDTLTSGGALA